MFDPNTERAIVFLITSILLILFLIGFLVLIINKYQEKQNAFFKGLEELKISHENDILQSRIEMQEQTFSNISREIHDNIGQKLTLAKLHLNSLENLADNKKSKRIEDVVDMIGEAIRDLSDISRSMSSEIILNNGFIKALEFEVEQLNKADLYKISLSITGEPVFMEANNELVLFRITQEALNNIVKHAEASVINLDLHYESTDCTLRISDNGKGFSQSDIRSNGLLNMDKRANMLNGSFQILSAPGIGTTITIKIPIDGNNKV